jgi:hypothetical protein
VVADLVCFYSGLIAFALVGVIKVVWIDLPFGNIPIIRVVCWFLLPLKLCSYLYWYTFWGWCSFLLGGSHWRGGTYSIEASGEHGMELYLH